MRTENDDIIYLKKELDDDDKVHIMEIFSEDVVKRLLRLQARIGVLNCEFAGKEYGNWTIQFKSTRSGFEIIDFEYDEDSCSFDLGLQPRLVQIRK